MELQPTKDRDVPARRARFLCYAGLCALVIVVVQMALSFGECPQDDAFISFRYARNLVRGHGLVFNPGEWVEGYSNLSWTLMMAALMKWGADPIRAAAQLGVLSVVITLVLLVWTQRSVTKKWSPALLIAPALLTIDAEMVLEAVEGLETTFYMALITAAVLGGIREIEKDRHHTVSTMLFSIAALTRPEAPLVFALFHLAAWIRSPVPRTRLRRSLMAASALGVVLLLLTLWRIRTYGAPLPNTFYAKTGGFAIPRGLRYLWAHMTGHILLWSLVSLRLIQRNWTPRVRIFLLICAGQLLYVLVIGGDFKPTGRFILPILPLLCLLGADAVRTTWRQYGRTRGVSGPSNPRRRTLLVWGSIIGLVAIGGRDLAHGYELSRTWADDRVANLHSRRLVGSFLAQEFPENTVLAIHSAGVIPYYADLPTIDMWGLSNAHIARTSPENMGEGLAGHEKTDPRYVFSLEPHLYLPEDRVFTFQAWELSPDIDVPDDFSDRYQSRSIPLPGERIRYLNLWMRRGLWRCRNSSIEFMVEDQTVRVMGRYRTEACESGELRTWADMDQDGVPARDPSCCFPVPEQSAAAYEPSLRRYLVESETSPFEAWDCDDENSELSFQTGDTCTAMPIEDGSSGSVPLPDDDAL